MKIGKFLMALTLTAVAFLATTLFVQAADTTTASPGTPTNWLQALIPLLAPGLIMVIKWVFPRIPKPALPILAPILGAGIDLIGHFTGLGGGNGLTGAILGAAGVAIREAYDQAKRSMAGQG